MSEPTPSAPIATLEKKEVGFITSAQDYLLYLEGLPSVRVNDILLTKDGNRAIVSALQREKIEALMLDAQRPKPGDSLTLDPQGLRLPMKTNLFGRAINPLGKSLDGRGGLPPGGELIDLDFVAPGIAARKRIDTQLATGVAVVDIILPIGKGQRELIIGEPRSAKSGFLLDIIGSQKKTNMVCIYTAIGKSETEVTRFLQSVATAQASNYTIIVAATSSESAPVISIAPSVACAIAEFFQKLGKDVLLILDDLASHAKYLREIALLSGRIPGRESYPSDIFYRHSQVVERAGSFNKANGGATITMLPVIETDADSLTNYVPTNVMSMTDGHIFFAAALRAQGYYPAIEIDRSVTRVGHQTQFLLQKVLSDKLRSLLSEYSELERFGHFGSELTTETQKTLKKGAFALELLKQEVLKSVDMISQVLFLGLIFTKFFDNKDMEWLKSKKSLIIKTLTQDQDFQKLIHDSRDSKFDEFVEKLSLLLPKLEAVCQQSST